MDSRKVWTKFKDKIQIQIYRVLDKIRYLLICCYGSSSTLCAAQVSGNYPSTNLLKRQSSHHVHNGLLFLGKFFIR